MSLNNQLSYRSIMKGTSIFGGVQVINILIGLIRGKLVALFLGASGMGVISLLTVVCNTIQQFASLGLNLAAVRDISTANSSGNIKEASEMVYAIRRMIHYSAIVGALFTVAFANWLSMATFGNGKYKWAFIFLSIFVFFSLLSNGEYSILQGFRKLKSLAIRNIAGALSGLVFGVPLYCFYGERGIVPAMIISAIVLYIFAWYGTRKIELVSVNQNIRESAKISRSIIIIGILMTIGTCLGYLANYIILGFVRSFGSIEDVGLYNAANSLTGQYISLVFAAMATDYYPRLSAISNDKAATSVLVNQQSELIVLVVAPISTLVFLTAPILIKLLFTPEFTPIVNVVRYMGYGLLFKAYCFPMGYLSIAKSDKVYYFATEGIWSNIKTVSIFVLFYYLYGLIGLGYATVVNSLLDVLVASALTNWRYGIKLSLSYYRLTIPLLLLETCCFVFSFMENIYLSYGLMFLTSTSVFYYSYKELDKRILLKALFREKLIGRFKK